LRDAIERGVTILPYRFQLTLKGYNFLGQAELIRVC